MKKRGRNREQELEADDLSEIEEGKIRTHCRACKNRQVVLVRLRGRETQDATEILTGERSHTMIGVCTNPVCFRYVLPKSVKSWVLKTSPVGY